MARRRSSCPPPSPNLVRTHPIEYSQALRHSALCLSRSVTLSKGIKLELGRSAHLGPPSSANHICRRVSTDRPNRKGSQLAASLEGEPGPTPAGNCLKKILNAVIVSHIQCIGCQPEKNYRYFTRWPIPLVVC